MCLIFFFGLYIDDIYVTFRVLVILSLSEYGLSMFYVSIWTLEVNPRVYKRFQSTRYYVINVLHFMIVSSLFRRNNTC